MLTPKIIVRIRTVKSALFNINSSLPFRSFIGPYFLDKKWLRKSSELCRRSLFFNCFFSPELFTDGNCLRMMNGFIHLKISVKFWDLTPDTFAKGCFVGKK